MINYYMNENGILYVYHDNKILFEISKCGNCSEKDIHIIIEEQLYDMGYTWLYNGEIEKESE